MKNRILTLFASMILAIPSSTRIDVFDQTRFHRPLNRSQSRAWIKQRFSVSGLRAQCMEESVYAWSGGDDGAYKRKLTSVLLMPSQQAMECAPWDIGFTTHMVRHDADESEQALQASIETECKAKQSTQATLRCPWCRGEEIELFAAQTRSADEGMTYRYRCCLCGHKFHVD